MNQIVFGLLSAFSLGTADFLARFSARAVGHIRALLWVFIVSCICLTGYLFSTDQSIVFDPVQQWQAVLFGVMNTIAMLLLYRALALGPLSLVAPIVAAHPAIVVVFAFLLGSRPSGLQWLGMLSAMIGAMVVARVVIVNGGEDASRTRAALIATAASFAYAILVISGQHATQIHGELQTLWLGRLVALLSLLPWLLVTRTSPGVPFKWWAWLLLQGTLDFAGVLFLLLGSRGEYAEITAVVGSLFGAVTILLARVFLRESISTYQWLGIVVIFLGVICLSYG